MFDIHRAIDQFFAAEFSFSDQKPNSSSSSSMKKMIRSPSRREMQIMVKKGKIAPLSPRDEDSEHGAEVATVIAVPAAVGAAGAAAAGGGAAGAAGARRKSQEYGVECHRAALLDQLLLPLLTDRLADGHPLVKEDGNVPPVPAVNWPRVRHAMLNMKSEHEFYTESPATMMLLGLFVMPNTLAKCTGAGAGAGGVGCSADTAWAGTVASTPFQSLVKQYDLEEQAVALAFLWRGYQPR
jgi:hypothetical protein